MLPPVLSELKRVLTEKGYYKRTSAEDQLLNELEALDKSPDVRKIILDENLATKSFRLESPSSQCPCCGRS